MTAFMNYADFMANYEKIMQGLSIDNLTPEEKKKIDDLLVFSESSKWQKRESKKMPNGYYYTISDFFDDSTSLFYCKGVTQIEIAPEEACLLFTQSKYGKEANPITKSIKKLGPDNFTFDQRADVRITTISQLVINSREFLVRYFISLDRTHTQAIYLSFGCDELDAKFAPEPGCVRGSMHIAAFIVTLLNDQNGTDKIGQKLETNGIIRIKKDENSKNGTDKKIPKSVKNFKNESERNKNLPKFDKNESKIEKNGKNLSKIPGKNNKRAPVSEVVYIVLADPKGWIPKKLVGLARNSQTRMVANLTTLVAENKKRYEKGKLDDVLVQNIFKRREEKAIGC